MAGTGTGTVRPLSYFLGLYITGYKITQQDWCDFIVTMESLTQASQGQVLKAVFEQQITDWTAGQEFTIIPAQGVNKGVALHRVVLDYETSTPFNELGVVTTQFTLVGSTIENGEVTMNTAQNTKEVVEFSQTTDVIRRVSSDNNNDALIMKLQEAKTNGVIAMRVTAYYSVYDSLPDVTNSN